MENIQKWSAYLEGEIKKIDWPLAPHKLYEPLRYFMTLGGKRMRPILTIMSAELFGKSGEDVLPSALAVELFHNFTLIHDDIMDDAPVRRGKTTVHEKWDNNVGILSGDALMIWSYKKLVEQGSHVDELMNIFNKTAIEVCEGQQMDMDFETSDEVQIDEYLEMIRLKTSVLLGCALQMGAIVANASKEDQEAIYNFGQEVGLAFQIKDDYLDLYGDPEKFGKQVGGDVMANKKTLLHLLALKHGTDSQVKKLAELMLLKNQEEKVEQVRNLFTEIGIPALAKAEINKHDKIAREALAKIARPDAAKKPLLDLSDYLLHREN